MKLSSPKLLILVLTLTLPLLFSAGSTVADVEGLILYLPLDEGEGDVVTDASGLGYEGTITNAEWVDGKMGKALEFNGADSLVSIEHQGVFKDTAVAMTAEAWIKAEESTGDYQFIIDQWDCPENEWILRINKDDKLGAVWTFRGEKHPVTKTIDPNTYPYSSDWHHIAVTFEDGTQKLYLDGELVATTFYGGTLSVGENDLVLGKNGNKAAGNYYKGVLDEVGLYNRVLTQDEIKRDMNKGVGFAVEKTPGKLVATWGAIKEKHTGR